ncbi:MAG: hypothetical protein CMJ64_16660 [Planctomycetaceae bacterium]|nr:hypothetical protein [Planctomycetaceae bacterium]
MTARRWQPVAILGIVSFLGFVIFAYVTLSESGPSPSRRPSVPQQQSLVGMAKQKSSAGEIENDQVALAEDFNESASRQLARVQRFLESGIDSHGVQAQELAGEDFTCPPLRPEHLEVVFGDASVEVARFQKNASATSNSHDVHVGGRGLVAALQGLLRPFDPAHARQVALRTVRVELGETEVSSEVHYQGSGPTDGGHLQQNARWVCRWTLGSPNRLPELRSIALEHFEEIRAKHGKMFSDETAQLFAGDRAYDQQLSRGVEYWRRRLQADFGVGLHGHHGLALGDVNGDRMDDVYLCQPAGLPNRLYLRVADGSLTEASALAGVDWLDRSRSALLVDLDNDSDQDLIIAMNVNVMIMANDGSGRFAEKATYYTSGDPTSLSAADYDADGDLDVYVTGYGSGFLATAEEDDTALGHAIPYPYHDANNGGVNLLLQNDGDWRFRDVTEDAGLDINNRRWSFAASWEDFDRDGDADLYVANDYGRNNLYRNDEGRFVDIAAEAGVEDIAAGMSVSWGDYNNDGWMDIYVGNMFSSAGNRIAYQRDFQPSAADATRAQFQRHARGNTLFENLRDGTFRDVSIDAAVAMGRWSWGSKFADLNNDGREDLLVANGYVTGPDTDDL